eukprot:2046704-Rhodomonas_salina.2
MAGNPRSTDVVATAGENVAKAGEEEHQPESLYDLVKDLGSGGKRKKVRNVWPDPDEVSVTLSLLVSQLNYAGVQVFADLAPARKIPAALLGLKHHL